MQLTHLRACVSSLVLVALQTSILLCCVGCVRFGGAYHLPPQLAPALDQYSNSVSDVTRNEPPPKVYGANPKIVKDATPSVLTLEFSEWGKLIDCPSQTAPSALQKSNDLDPNCQLRRAQTYIREAGENLPPGKSLAVVTFIHGWHHNSSWSSENFRNFQRAIDCLNWGADDYKVIYSTEVVASHAMICEHTQASNVRYVGVYVGWRGESLKVPGNAFKFLQAANFPSRRLGAERMARPSSDLYRALTKVAKEARAMPIPATTVVVGHSFGGLILSRVALNNLSAACPPVATGTSPNVSFGPCDKDVADLLVLINPADNAIRSAMLIADWHRNGVVAPFARAASGSPATLPAPIIVSMFTPSDSATRYIQMAALWTTNLPADQIYPGARKITNEMKRTTAPALDTIPRFYPVFRSRPPNGIKYLRNLCWLDQPAGLTADAACNETWKELGEIKRDLFNREVLSKEHHKMIGCLDRGPTPGKPCTNERYNSDPYEHGVWELLTSICWLENEDPTPVSEYQGAHRKPEEWWPWDFPNAVSCAGNDARRDQRKKLAQEFQTALRDYLAVPNLLEENEYGNALFDLYLRREMETTPAGTTHWKTAWNDTPFWLVNLPRETIQNHSGIWNAEVFSLISDLASVSTRSNERNAEQVAQRPVRQAIQANRD